MVEAPPAAGATTPPLLYTVLSGILLLGTHLMPGGTVFPYSLPPSCYLSVSNLWLIIVVLPCPGCSCDGDIPDAAQGRLGSLNDQPSTVFSTVPLQLF